MQDERALIQHEKDQDRLLYAEEATARRLNAVYDLEVEVSPIVPPGLVYSLPRDLPPLDFGVIRAPMSSAWWEPIVVRPENALIITDVV